MTRNSNPTGHTVITAQSETSENVPLDEFQRFENLATRLVQTGGDGDEKSKP